MNFAAFIKSISVNSNINFNKQWLTLLRGNYKHWPWSLVRYKDFLFLYIIFYNLR